MARPFRRDRRSCVVVVGVAPGKRIDTSLFEFRTHTRHFASFSDGLASMCEPQTVILFKGGARNNGGKPLFSRGTIFDGGEGFF